MLRPGVVSVTKDEGSADVEKFFVSGGFAFMHPDNTCSVNAVEAIPLSELDIEAARAGLAKFEVCVTVFCLVHPEISCDFVVCACACF